jgi:hypothetical protein
MSAAWGANVVSNSRLVTYGRRMETFSGAHPFQPQHLNEEMRLSDGTIDHATTLIELIDARRCPRCGAALPDRPQPKGSVATDCRCIPICALCGRDEPIWGTYVSIWPIPESVVAERVWAQERKNRKAEERAERAERRNQAALDHMRHLNEHRR